METKLRGGHTQCVLSTTTTADGAKIFSGSEGGEISVWNLDGERIKTNKTPSGEDVTSLCSSRLHPDILLVASGDKILFYDMRNFTEPYESHGFNKEEINCLALNEKEDFLAACDDSGEVKVIRMQDKQVYKTLRKHTNICSTISFRPRRPWDLVSGGYDYQLLQWDFSRARSVCSINVQELGTLDHSTSSYLINPPFIHALDVSGDGQYLACALENSLVHVLKANKRTPEYMATLNGHTQGVSQVHFPKYSPHTLISGGNDGQILFWDLQAQQAAANGHANGHHVNGHINGNTSNGHHANGQNGAAANAGEGDAILTGAFIEDPTCFIDHGAKVNWISSGATQNRKYIVVADNSNDLSLYNFPL